MHSAETDCGAEPYLSEWEYPYDHIQEHGRLTEQKFLTILDEALRFSAVQNLKICNFCDSCDRQQGKMRSWEQSVSCFSKRIPAWSGRSVFSSTRLIFGHHNRPCRGPHLHQLRGPCLHPLMISMLSWNSLLRPSSTFLHPYQEETPRRWDGLHACFRARVSVRLLAQFAHSKAHREARSNPHLLSWFTQFTPLVTLHASIFLSWLKSQQDLLCSLAEPLQHAQLNGCFRAKRLEGSDSGLAIEEQTSWAGE